MKKLILIIFICTAANTLAQGSWGAQFRPGLNIPLNDLGEDNLEVGFGFEVSFAYKVMPHLKGVFGWSYNNFETDMNVMKNSTRLNENSFMFGFELRLPITEPPLTYFVYAGSVLGQIQMLDAQKTFNERSGYGIGWQFGAGAEFYLDGQWSLKPGIRFRSLSRDVDIAMTTVDINLDYLSVGVGLSYTF